MKASHVEFRSSKFAPYEGEAEQINPGRYGKRLAEYLQLQLAAEGIQTGDMWAEDWGWAIPIRGLAPQIWIGCGNYEEYEDGFLCFVEPRKGYARRWLVTKLDVSADHAKVVDALARILSADPDIREVRWWDPAETQ
jgi:hypothetical protein